jgi:hypothetical protein
MGYAKYVIASEKRRFEKELFGTIMSKFTFWVII